MANTRFDDDTDLGELLKFGKLYASLGSAVQDQLDDLIEEAWSAVNPNAVDIIEQRLGRMHPEIAEAIQLYHDWRLGKEEEDAAEAEETQGKETP